MSKDGDCMETTLIIHILFTTPDQIQHFYKRPPGKLIETMTKITGRVPVSVHKPFSCIAKSSVY